MTDIERMIRHLEQIRLEQHHTIERLKIQIVFIQNLLDLQLILSDIQTLSYLWKDFGSQMRKHIRKTDRS